MVRSIDRQANRSIQLMGRWDDIPPPPRNNQAPPFRNPPPTTEWKGRPVGWQPPPAPPPMRNVSTPHVQGVGVLLVLLVFTAGIAIGAKMAGGW